MVITQRSFFFFNAPVLGIKVKAKAPKLSKEIETIFLIEINVNNKNPLAIYIQ